jgi:hypothetical protein
VQDNILHYNCSLAAASVTVTSGGFGTISAAYPPRNIQMALEIPV